MKFTQVSVFVKIAFVVIIIMFLLDIIGFATTSWVTSGSSDRGLWSWCISSVCGSYAATTSKFDAARAFEVLGLIVAIATLVVIVVYLFVPPCADKDVLALVTMILCFVTGALIILGVIIFSTMEWPMWDYGYSFALCIVAAILAVIAGILLLVDKFMGK